MCVCVNRVVKEEKEIAYDNRKGGWCGRYGLCVSLCADREVSTQTSNWNYCECRVVVGPALSLSVTHTHSLSSGPSFPTEGCDCGFDHCPIRRDLAMTISQPARPDPTGLPRGRHMMGPTVTTHGLSVSQICPFVSEKQSIRLSLLFGGVMSLFVWFLDFSETCLSS